MKDCSLVIEDNCIKLYIDGLLHLNLKQSEFIGFQSWIQGDKSKKYCIEFYMKTNEILTQYDEIDKWTAVLKVLDNRDLHGDFTNF